MAKETKNEETNGTVSSSSCIGMAVKHYQSSFGSSVVHQMTEDFGESNTDISNWKPKVSTIRAFLGSPNSQKKHLVYDFPDGKDNGSSVQTFLRTPGLDITEIETAEKIVTQIVQDKKALADADAKDAAESKALLDALRGIKESSADNSASTEQNNSNSGQ